MIKACVICGAEIESINRRLTCSKECSKMLKAQGANERKKRHRPAGQNMKEIERICVEAKQAGMSYGNYVAIIDKGGKSHEC